MTSTVATGQQDAVTEGTQVRVRWNGAFWGSCLERTRTTTVPSMWGSLRDAELSGAWQNFLVAAGDVEGEHSGPPFLDGDLYKWLEAAISLLESDSDPELAAKVDDVVAMVARIQREDGYVHTPTFIADRQARTAQPLADRFDFEMYNLGHLITAGVRHHKVTGSHTLLDVARKAAGFLESLAEHDRDELARSAICPSHYLAVVQLYRATGEARYLRLAEAFLRVRDDFNGGDDNQDRLPVLQQRVAAGHAVRANYLYAGLAGLATETGDTRLREVLEGLWDDVVQTKLYVTGGCGALYDGASPDGNPVQSDISRVHQAYGRAYQLPHTTAHNESCANIGMMLWSEQMLDLTGEVKYADVIEQIAYNSLLSSISLDGRRYTYTNPLRQVRDLPYPLRMPGETAQRPVPTPPASDARARTEYMSCFCCPPNIARTLARMHELAVSASPSGVRVMLYGNAEARVDLADGRGMGLRMRSEQPWDERVEITVTDVEREGLPVQLRVPWWAEGASVVVDGGPAESLAAGSWAVLDRAWKEGDVVELTLPVRTRLRRGHRLAEETTNQVVVSRGPVVYAVESHDLPEGVRLEQVALRRDVELRPQTVELEGERVVVLQGQAALLPTKTDTGLYPDVEQGGLQSFTVRLVPYFAWGNRGPGEMSVWLPVVW